MSEFPIVDGRPDPALERILLRIAQPFPNHNGGTIAFDAQGYLLIGMGDGGGGGDPARRRPGPGARCSEAPAHRVDSRGRPVRDPAGQRLRRRCCLSAGDPRVRACATRGSSASTRTAGDIYIADVGQGDIEEVSVLPGGAGGVSLGWNRFEGDRCFSEPCDPAAHLGALGHLYPRRGLHGRRRPRVPRHAPAGLGWPLPVRRLLLWHDLGGRRGRDARRTGDADAHRADGWDAGLVRSGRGRRAARARSRWPHPPRRRR